MINNKIMDLACNIQHQLVNDRRYLHQNPELSFNEYNTMDYICSRLDSLGIPYKNKIAGTGVLAEIKGKKPGKCLLIRADMDALPLQEKKDTPYRSVNNEVMHACGHDAHTAILLNTCEVLHNLKDKFSGTIKFVFQPGEETTGGADPMIKAGILDNPKVDACIALHVDSDLNTGTIRVKPEAMYAALAEFSIIIKGKGGHGAEPHNAIDPIVISAQIITQLQNIISRNIDPFDEAVVTIGSIHAGQTNNVIPDTAVMLGTARSLTDELRDYLEKRIEAVIKSVCDCFDAKYEYIFDKLYPTLVNNSAIAKELLESGKRCLGEENCIYGGRATMASEDFAYFTRAVPSALFKLGCRNEDKEITASIHNPYFDIDEDCLKYGVAMFVDFALHFLN